MICGMVPVSDRIWIKPDEVWITGSKIRKDEENKNEKENREQLRKEMCSSNPCGSDSSMYGGCNRGNSNCVCQHEENKTLVYAGEVGNSDRIPF